MRTSGERVYTSGRRRGPRENRSHTASLIQSRESRLFSGERLALTSTRMLCVSLNHSDHFNREVPLVYRLPSPGTASGKPHQDRAWRAGLRDWRGKQARMVALECDPARNGLGFLAPEGPELFGEKRFEAPRTGGREGLQATADSA